MQILVSLELLPIQISSQGFLGKRVSQTYWATDPICESAFSQTLILPRINFSAQPAWQRYTKRKINKIGCFTIKKEKLAMSIGRNTGGVGSYRTRLGGHLLTHKTQDMNALALLKPHSS